MVEETREGEAATAEDGDEGAEEMEESREIEGVGPEEDPSGWASAERETEEPLKRGFGSAPEPARVADLGQGGEEETEEDGGGDEDHGERVDGWEWAERDRTSPAEEGEGEMKEEGGDEVDGDGGEEE